MPWTLQLILLICSSQSVKEHQPLQQPWRCVSASIQTSIIECILICAVSSMPVGGSHINVVGCRCRAFKIHQLPKCIRKREITLNNRCSFTSCEILMALVMRRPMVGESTLSMSKCHALAVLTRAKCHSSLLTLQIESFSFFFVQYCFFFFLL